MQTRPFKPGKLLLYWQKKDASKATIYYRGKKMSVVTIWPTDDGIVGACAAFMEGWFGTEDRAQWNYRIQFG